MRTEEDLVGDKLLQYAQIASLKDKQDWAAVCEQLRQKTDMMLSTMQADILRGVFEQRHADYIRGWNAASEWIRHLPNNATRQYTVLKAKEGKQ